MSTETASTSINLTKGQKIDLTKTNPGLKLLHLGLGWDENDSAGKKVDLDAFAVMLKSGKFVNDKDLIYFNNLTSVDGSIVHSGDNLTGKGDGEDEVITIDLSKVPADCDRIIVGANIYQADERNQTFGMVKNAFIRVANKDGNTELAKFDLSENYSTGKGANFAEIYRHEGVWKFSATGVEFAGSLVDFCQKYK
jgi:tellurium resistance protein TerD